LKAPSCNATKSRVTRHLARTPLRSLHCHTRQQLPRQTRMCLFFLNSGVFIGIFQSLQPCGLVPPLCSGTAPAAKFAGEIYFQFDLLFNRFNFHLERVVTRCHGLTKLNSSVRGARFALAMLDSAGRDGRRMPGMRLIRGWDGRRLGWFGRVGRVGGGDPGGLWITRAADPSGRNRTGAGPVGRGSGKVSPIECDLRHTLGRPLTVV